MLFELDYVLAGLDAKRNRVGTEARRQHLFTQMLLEPGNLASNGSRQIRSRG